MKNTTQSTHPHADRLARREQGRRLIRRATRGAAVGGIALTAVFAGVAYHATQAKSSSTAVSARHASTGAKRTTTSGTSTTSSGSRSSAVAQSTATPVASSGGS